MTVALINFARRRAKWLVGVAALLTVAMIAVLGRTKVEGRTTYSAAFWTNTNSNPACSGCSGQGDGNR